MIRFNRFYEQQLREADKRFLAVYEMTLTEQRILLDLGDHTFGLTAVRICWDLKLNSGYVCRVLQKFRKYRLVDAERWDRDRRQQIVTLTQEGHRVYADLRSFSRLRAEDMLQPLPPAMQKRLVNAMRTIQNVLTADPGEMRMHYGRLP